MITNQPNIGDKIEFFSNEKKWEYAGTVVGYDGNICYLLNEREPVTDESLHKFWGPNPPRRFHWYRNVNNCFIWRHHDGTLNQFRRVAK